MMDRIGQPLDSNIPPVPLRRANDPKKIDKWIWEGMIAVGISCRSEEDPENLKHTYTVQNSDQTKTLEFVGISHLDNLKRHAQQYPLEKDATLARINEFMERLATVIQESNPNHTTLIIEGMDPLTSEKSKEQQQAFIDNLKKKYPTMDWTSPNIDAFIDLPNSSETEFAVLLAFEKGMTILSSESDTHQVIELCRRLERRDLISEHIPSIPSGLHVKECAFFYFCCRDLIRWHSKVHDGLSKKEHLDLNIQRMIDRYSDILPFHGYHMGTIQKVSQHLWGENKLYDRDIAIQMNALIAPFPMEHITELSNIAESEKKKIQIMNSISQLLTHIRNRQIIDESIKTFEHQKKVISVFGTGHGHACFHAFEYAMQNM